MAGAINNKFLINAPAGSGKTTSIRSQLKSILLNNPYARILCITYTNRATEELSKDLNKTNVLISTIHSYISDLISPFFKEKGIIDLYWSLFGDRIISRIENKECDATIAESNARYAEKFGGLNDDIVKRNISEISYGETPFTSLYYGKLSHDDLLLFAYSAIEKYPNILRKIGEKYDYIFIDEYQDTSAFVLKIFYKAVKNNPNVKLYLLGDRMQQIYRNYDGTFKKEFDEFDTSHKFETNYRSSSDIVDILNKIYNDDDYRQKPSEKNKDTHSELPPKIIISDDINKSVEEIQSKIPGILSLHLMNKEKYSEIGAANLYKCFASMEMYSFGKKYSASDVLSDLSDDNPDTMMRFLFFAIEIMNLYKQHNYGVVISKCKKQTHFFNSAALAIQRNSDKQRIKTKFDRIIEICDEGNCKIKDCLNAFNSLGLIKPKLIEDVSENVEYNAVLDVNFSEVKNIFSYVNRPTVSTQHGVKGESHQSVLFIATDNNNNPNVRMYDFLNLWANYDFSLTEFENIYYEYLKIVLNVYDQIGKETRNLNSEDLKNGSIQTILDKCVLDVLEKFKKNSIFCFLLKSDFDQYLEKHNVSTAKSIFKMAKIEGVLTAYKLFYVGCSRARMNLLVIVDKNKLSKYEEKFINKAKWAGFQIEKCTFEK